MFKKINLYVLLVFFVTTTFVLAQSGPAQNDTQNNDIPSDVIPSDAISNDATQDDTISDGLGNADSTANQNNNEATNNTAPNSQNYFGIYHQPSYDSSSLPAPGYPLQMVVQLFNIKDVNIPIKTMANIDGKLIELTPSRVYLNKDDYPEYVIETHAPLASIDYYFIAYGQDGYVATSEKFSIRRPCLPDVQPVQAGLDSNPRDGQARLAEIVQKAWGLEKEIKTYEHLHKISEAINLELARLDGKR